ncbi:MAG: acyl-CoA desaturase [Nevskia sp.]|nr:acyl-CoA desaturase [Nevskia sp.]
MTPRKQLSREQVAAFQAEIDAVRNEVKADLGERDVAHIRRVIRIARGSAVAGRSLLMFGFGPASWLLGVTALANAKILENMEIGHNVMHGQYDWTNDPALASQTYEWDNVCDAEQWRHSHNFMHHSYTNIVGKDRDVGYGILRMSDKQPWNPYHLFQPVSNLLLALLFEWGVGLHDVEFERVFAGKVSREQFAERMRPFLRKARKQMVKDYLLFPALALWNWPRVLAGNVAANLIRNVWAYAIIFCGHFPEGAETFTEEETRDETRGDWYLRQITGSANLEGGPLFHIMSGHLSHQIEHHLFPDLPAHRYAEVAPRVRAICEKYGVRYNTGGFWKQYFSVMRSVFRHALPSRAPQPALA